MVMIYEMLFNDVLRFFIIYGVFLAGFSQAFFILFDYNGNTPTPQSVVISLITSFRFQRFSRQCQAMLLGHAGRFRLRRFFRHHLSVHQRVPTDLLHRGRDNSSPQSPDCYDGRYLW